MTSATEELRRMLDERGVEHTQTIVTEGVLFTVLTSNEHYFILVRDNNAGIEMWSQYLTPEQAIAATLGAGTCQPREVRSRFSMTQERVTYYCECGHELGGYMTAELPFPHTYNEDELPNYCPNCGRRIEK